MSLLRDQNIPFEENFLGARVTTDASAPGSDATAGNITYTAAQLLAEIFVRNGGTLARTDVFPTAALIVAALAAKYGKATVGMRFDWLLVNDGGVGGTVAITLGAGMTSGLAAGTQVSAAIVQNASRRYSFRVTNVGAGTEAVVVYA